MHACMDACIYAMPCHAMPCHALPCMHAMHVCQDVNVYMHHAFMHIYMLHACIYVCVGQDANVRPKQHFLALVTRIKIIDSRLHLDSTASNIYIYIYISFALPSRHAVGHLYIYIYIYIYIHIYTHASVASDSTARDGGRGGRCGARIGSLCPTYDLHAISLAYLQIPRTTYRTLL